MKPTTEFILFLAVCGSTLCLSACVTTTTTTTEPDGTVTVIRVTAPATGAIAAGAAVAAEILAEK